MSLCDVGKDDVLNSLVIENVTRELNLFVFLTKAKLLVPVGCKVVIIVFRGSVKNGQSIDLSINFGGWKNDYEKINFWEGDLKFNGLSDNVYSYEFTFPKNK